MRKTGGGRIDRIDPGWLILSKIFSVFPLPLTTSTSHSPDRTAMVRGSAAGNEASYILFILSRLLISSFLPGTPPGLV
jgi:hypothetical protein